MLRFIIRGTLRRSSIVMSPWFCLPLRVCASSALQGSELIPSFCVLYDLSRVGIASMRAGLMITTTCCLQILNSEFMMSYADGQGLLLLYFHHETTV